MNALIDGVWSRFVLVCVMLVAAPLARAAEPPESTAPAASTPLVATPGAPQKAPAAPDPQVLYALGVQIARNLDDFQLSRSEFEQVEAGLADAFNHRAKPVDLTLATRPIQMLRRERIAIRNAKQIEDAKAYLDAAAMSRGAQKTESGLVIVPIRAGAGAAPGPKSKVTVHYEGKLMDGTIFDSSGKRDQPATFSMDGVIPCWSQALPLMKVGEKARIVCPSELAYGAHGSPPRIGPNALLDFEVELLSVGPAP